jgi:hypothetical protein
MDMDEEKKKDKEATRVLVLFAGFGSIIGGILLMALGGVCAIIFESNIVTWAGILGFLVGAIVSFLLLIGRKK